MSKNFNVSQGVERLAARLAKLSREAEQEMQKLITTITLLTQEAIVEKITDDIEPHSGLSRKNNPQPVVTDLVDTGFYRSSWQVSIPALLTGKVATNCVYALALEYGFNNESINVAAHDRSRKGKNHSVKAHTRTVTRKGFFVARATAEKMRRVFRKRGIELLRKYTQ